MNNRCAAVLVALILAIGGFFIAKELTPKPHRYEFLPFQKNWGVYRGDLKTGDVQLFVLYEGKLTSLSEYQQLKSSRDVTSTGSTGSSDYSLTDDQMRALGLDPATGEVADFALFNRALQERGLQSFEP